jgi:hypothetical protein
VLGVGYDKKCTKFVKGVGHFVIKVGLLDKIMSHLKIICAS